MNKMYAVGNSYKDTDSPPNYMRYFDKEADANQYASANVTRDMSTYDLVVYELKARTRYSAKQKPQPKPVITRKRLPQRAKKVQP